MKKSSPNPAQLELITESLRIPCNGVRIAERGLTFRGAETDSELVRVGSALFGVRSVLKWSLGSLFAEMQRRSADKKQREEKKRAEGCDLPAWHDQRGGVRAGDFAESHQLDPKEFREVLGVFTFYQGAKDMPRVSFEHAREAMWAVDDGQPRQSERALAYLRLAEERSMTLTQLRRHMRSSGVTEPVETMQLDLAQYSAVFDFRRWAQGELDKLPNYTPERARVILVDIGESTLSYIDALRAIAAGTKPAITSASPTSSDRQPSRAPQ
jgi:hypothetical protein